jgi:hypothetical protein
VRKLFGRKKRIIQSLNDKKDFDCRKNKSSAHISYFHPDSSWAVSRYTVPHSFLEFSERFDSLVQSMIDNAEITSSNGATLDQLIDTRLHIALRLLEDERIAHKHSLQEIQMTKEANIMYLELLINHVKELKEKIEEEYQWKR